MQLQEWLEEGRTFQVFDLRRDDERASTPLRGLKPFPADRDADLPLVDDPVVLVCEIGIITESFIDERGLKNAWSLLGGAQAWAALQEEHKDFSRWSRQTALPELGVDGQRKLGAAAVAVVGVGGLGCPAAQSLAMAGIGRLILIDGDRVELSNLHRQPLFGDQDVGRHKTEAAADRLRLLNPDLLILTRTDFLDETNGAEHLSGADLILDATDNLAARRALDHWSRRLGKPLVYGALFRFEGQVAVLNHRGGPGYRDLFPEDGQAGQTCEDAGVLGMVPGIIGNIQALEAVKILTGIEPDLSGRLLIYDGLAHTTCVINISGRDSQE